MKIIGLTGDPGAGKSTFAEVFTRCGVPVYSADEIAKDALACPAFRQKAIARWGKDFFLCDRATLYKKIADKIFNSLDEYDFVTSFSHSFTIETIKKSLSNLPSDTPLAVVELPLLFETNCQEWMDEVIYISASLEKRKERNKSRHWTEEEIARREAKFLPRSTRMAASSLVIENTGTAQEWQETAEKICHTLQEKFK